MDGRPNPQIVNTEVQKKLTLNTVFLVIFTMKMEEGEGVDLHVVPHQKTEAVVT